MDDFWNLDAAPWDDDHGSFQSYTSSRGPWFGLSQSYAYEIGRTATFLDTGTRLLLLAVGLADKYGHAEFAKGDLEGLLDVDRTNVSRALGKLKKAGIAAEESSPLCVLLVHELRLAHSAPRLTCTFPERLDNLGSQLHNRRRPSDGESRSAQPQPRTALKSQIRTPSEEPASDGVGQSDR